MAESDVFERVRAYGEDRRFRAATLERWLGLEAENAQALLDLAERLRLGDNQLRDLWDWLEEIADRDGETLASVVQRDALRNVFRRGLGRADAFKGYKATLRRLRYPALAAQEARIAALVECLGLPASIRVEWPEFLEGDRLAIAIEIRSPEALRAAADALAGAAERPECAEIFAVLDGAGG